MPLPFQVVIAGANFTCPRWRIGGFLSLPRSRMSKRMKCCAQRPQSYIGLDISIQVTRASVLAILGQRFGLKVTFGHPDSVEHLEKGVVSHLRMCLATTLDRKWWFTSYPFEPLLSCVAASDLHAAPGILESALGTLLTTVSFGMIDMGQRGELASRLLWLLAKDLFIRTRAKNVVIEMPTTREGHLADRQ